MDIVFSRKFFLILGFCGWMAALSGLWGEMGLYQVFFLLKTRTQLLMRREELIQKKKELSKQVFFLKKDVYTQEKYIRDVLGYGRSQELVFVFDDSIP